MVRSKSYIEGSTSQYRPIKPVQAALIIDFRARGHTAPDCGCAMLTAVCETMLRLKATSLRRKLEDGWWGCRDWTNLIGIWQLALAPLWPGRFISFSLFLRR